MVRDLSGFGSSMIGVGALSLRLPPARLNPDPMRLFVSACLLVIALLMRSGLAADRGGAAVLAAVLAAGHLAGAAWL